MISSASSDLAQEVFVADTGVEVAFVPEAMEISSIVAVPFCTGHRVVHRSCVIPGHCLPTVVEESSVEHAHQDL